MMRGIFRGLSSAVPVFTKRFETGCIIRPDPGTMFLASSVMSLLQREMISLITVWANNFCMSFMTALHEGIGADGMLSSHGGHKL